VSEDQVFCEKPGNDAGKWVRVLQNVPGVGIAFSATWRALEETRKGHFNPLTHDGFCTNYSSAVKVVRSAELTSVLVPCGVSYRTRAKEKAGGRHVRSLRQIEWSDRLLCPGDPYFLRAVADRCAAVGVGVGLFLSRSCRAFRSMAFLKASG
jgi:hypothetical protein